MNELIERLCSLPQTFKHGKVSTVALLKASGYLEGQETLTVLAVLDVLKSNPALVDDWELWSEDKRVNQGWALSREGSDFIVFRFATPGARWSDELHTMHGGRYTVLERHVFSDRLEACAHFVVREIRSIAEHIS